MISENFSSSRCLLSNIYQEEDESGTLVIKFSILAPPISIFYDFSSPPHFGVNFDDMSTSLMMWQSTCGQVTKFNIIRVPKVHLSQKYNSIQLER